jgi:hypothetical protein
VGNASELPTDDDIGELDGLQLDHLSPVLSRLLVMKTMLLVIASAFRRAWDGLVRVFGGGGPKSPPKP